MDNHPAVRHPAGPRRVQPRPVVATNAQAEVFERLAAADTPLTVGELADTAGQHVNTVREHLSVLVDLGLVTRSPLAPAGRGRPAQAYAVRARDEQPARLALLTSLVRHVAATDPDPQRLAERLGREAGRAMAEEHRRSGESSGTPTARARSVVTETMDELGFDPEATPRSRVVRLRTCPLLELADTDQEVVCGFHRGMLRGLLESDAADVDLEPFAEAGSCIVRLG